MDFLKDKVKIENLYEFRSKLDTFVDPNKLTKKI